MSTPIPQAELSPGWAADAASAPAVVVVLHGYGSHERDLAGLAPALGLALPWASRRARSGSSATHLQAEPFSLPTTVTSLPFVVYLAGTVASQRFSTLGDCIGTTRALVAGSVTMLVSLPIMASGILPVMVVGRVLFTVGCFCAQPLASGLRGRAARVGRSQSTALFQISWLGGTSLFGWFGGIVYTAGRRDRPPGWPRGAEAELRFRLGIALTGAFPRIPGSKRSAPRSPR
ncbi:MAG: hypothetical protein H7146_04820 [Burkholderiaceae bacterium]|nr:hypothetical protein [Microbacteriaceae bacterium]